MYFSAVRYQRLWLASALLLSVAGCSFHTPLPQATDKSAQSKPFAQDQPLPPPALSARFHIEVIKSSRTLRLWRGDQLQASYGIALGGSPVGHKSCQGDSRTPEGVYTVTQRKADSSFYRALRLSYPNAQDRAHAARLGCDPGGDIMIHGLPNGRGYIGSSHRVEDWTEGCIALTNEEMDRLWALVPVGTRVEIRP